MQNSIHILTLLVDNIHSTITTSTPKPKYFMWIGLVPQNDQIVMIASILRQNEDDQDNEIEINNLQFYTGKNCNTPNGLHHIRDFSIMTQLII